MESTVSHSSNSVDNTTLIGFVGYITETKRLYSGTKCVLFLHQLVADIMRCCLVLNDRLTDREYLVGPGKGKYGLADINTFPWVRSWRWAGVDSLDDFPNVEVRGISIHRAY